MGLPVLCIAVVAAMSAPTASADTLSSKRAQAKAAQAHLATLESAAEKQIEVYDGIHQKFLNTRNAIRLNEQSLKVAQANLKAAEKRLEASLTETYKTGGEDAFSYLLAARSIGELVDQMQVMQRVNGINKTLLNQVTRYKAEVATRQTRLAKLLKTVRAQQAASAAARARAVAAVHRQKSYISNLKASIQKILDEQAAAASGAAAAAAGAGGLDHQHPDAAVEHAGRPGGRDRRAVPGRALRLGRREPVGLRLLRARRCTSTRSSACRFRTTRLAQYVVAAAVPLSALEPGDLVFFDGASATSGSTSATAR